MIEMPTEAEPSLIVCGDAIDVLRRLPDNSIDLLFTSPPYERARTYGISKALPAGQDWVNWMVAVVKAAAPKVKGLIAINCEGQTRGFAYSGVPFLLFADLLRAGFNMRKPVVFSRVGIPGSGGPDWLRNDWEPIICITRDGKLPWSDNTACGHPPKWAPGGEMSHMLSNGTRTNQWGKTGAKTGTTMDGSKEKPGIGKPRPSHLTLTKSERDGPRFDASKDGTTKGSHARNICTLANPGNVKQLLYTAEEVADMLGVPSDVVPCNVGGGQMGHSLAHQNEAPFPLELPTFFVRSFCPSGGIVADPFCGSGTVGHAALEYRRRFIGIDVRQSQVDLTTKRLASGITPELFTGAA